MNEQQILQKAWDKIDGENAINSIVGSTIYYTSVDDDAEFAMDLYFFLYSSSFNFARRFWGEELVDEHGRTQKEFYETEKFNRWIDTHKMEKWKYHLKVMVLLDNPIPYLETFLDAD